MLRSPTAAASAAASRASSSSRPTSTIGCSGSASQASLEPKPARRAVMQTAPGMCASSNCSSVRTSTTSAPSLVGLLDLARASAGARRRSRLTQRAAVERDDVLEVRRLRARASRSSCATNSSSSAICSSSWCGALEADRRGDLEVHARARRTASRRGARARPRTCRAASAACRRASGRCRARPPPCRRRGRAGRCRRRTACRRSAPPTARRRAPCRSARTRCARAGGRACAARGPSATPSSSSQPSSNGSWS